MPALPPPLGPDPDDRVPPIVWLVCLLVLAGFVLASTLQPLP